MTAPNHRATAPENVQDEQPPHGCDEDGLPCEETGEQPSVEEISNAQPMYQFESAAGSAALEAVFDDSVALLFDPISKTQIADRRLESNEDGADSDVRLWLRDLRNKLDELQPDVSSTLPHLCGLENLWNHFENVPNGGFRGAALRYQEINKYSSFENLRAAGVDLDGTWLPSPSTLPVPTTPSFLFIEANGLMLLTILLKIEAPLALIFDFFSLGIGDESLPLLRDVLCRVPYFTGSPATVSEFLKTQKHLLSKFRPGPLVANQHTDFTHGSTVPVPDGDLIYTNGACDVRVHYVRSPIWSLTLNAEDDALVPRTANGEARELVTKAIGGLKDPIFVKESFYREVDALRTIKDSRHRHFVPYLTSFTSSRYHPQMPWYTIVMPYLPFNLSDLLELEDAPKPTTNMSETEQRKVLVKKTLRDRKKEVLNKSFLSIRCVVHAVCFIHHGITLRLEKCRRIYHHDLKPSNILMDGSLEAKLADFNISSVKHQSDESNTTQNTSTPMYEPPEKNLNTQVGTAYDLWGLGCVLLEMVIFVTCEISGSEMSATTYFKWFRKRFCTSAVGQFCQHGHPHREKYCNAPHQEGCFKDCMPAVRKWTSWLRDPGNAEKKPWIVGSKGQRWPIEINLRQNQLFNSSLLSRTLDLIEQMMSLEPSGRPTAQGAQQQLDDMSFPTDDCCRHPFYGPPTNFYSRPRVSSFASLHLDVPSTRRPSYASCTSSPPFSPRSLHDVSMPVPSFSPALKRRRGSNPTNGAGPSLKRFRTSQGEENCNMPNHTVPSRIPRPARTPRSPLSGTSVTSGSSSSASSSSHLRRANNVLAVGGSYITH